MIQMKFNSLKNNCSNILENTDLKFEEKLFQICQTLKNEIEYYDWVGFYFKNGDKDELILGPYAGAPTDHTIIPFGKGICGQVAVSNKNFVVEDVSAQDNYISCNFNVKSEIVIPLFVEGKNIGQIDIDSNTLRAFSNEDEFFLEWLNNEISKIYNT